MQCEARGRENKLDYLTVLNKPPSGRSSGMLDGVWAGNSSSLLSCIFGFFIVGALTSSTRLSAGRLPSLVFFFIQLWRHEG